MRRVIPLSAARPREPKPYWLKVRAPGSPSYLRLKGLMRELGLHTVCEEARCPNIGECWNHGTATFMILGDVCTRACSYCAVAHGRPATVDAEEPARRAAKESTIALFDEARDLYAHFRFTDAGRVLAAARAIDPHDAALDVLAARCSRYELDPPPPEWQGVEALDFK